MYIPEINRILLLKIDSWNERRTLYDDIRGNLDWKVQGDVCGKAWEATWHGIHGLVFNQVDDAVGRHIKAQLLQWDLEF